MQMNFPLLIVKSAHAPKHIFGGFISIIDLLLGAFRVIYVVPQKGKCTQEVYTMEIRFNVTGTRRKEMVGIISEVIGMKAVYKGYAHLRVCDQQPDRQQGRYPDRR